MKLLMFSKNIDSLPIEEEGQAIKQMGFDGVDLTVRPAQGSLRAGRVLPENVRKDLPDAIKSFAKFDLEVPMICTAISGADEKYAKDIFETAGANGVSVVRLNLWDYEGFGTFSHSMDVVSRRLDKIEKLAERTGVQAVIHVHSGNILSANPVIVWYWIKDRNPAAIGAYVDLEHTTLETGPASRTMALDLLGKRTNVIGVKDYAWKSEKGNTLTTEFTRWRVPVGTGVVPWKEVFFNLQTAGADPLVSVHSEYLGKNSWHVLSVPELIKQTTEDVAYLRSAMKS